LAQAFGLFPRFAWTLGASAGFAMMPESEQDTVPEIDVPQQEQHWRYLALAVVAAFAGAALLADSFNGKPASLSTSSPREMLVLSEGMLCDCRTNRIEGMKKCPAWSFQKPFAAGICQGRVLATEKKCLADCAKSKLQQGKDAAGALKGSATGAVDSAKKAATNGVNSATGAVDSAKKAATDGVNSVKDSAKQTVDSAKNAATDGVGSTLAKGKDTVESVTNEIATQSKCFQEFLACMKKCGVDVPSNVPEDLEKLDTHDMASGAKDCVAKCEDAKERCTQD